MLFPLDNNLLTKGFCWGQFEPKIDDEGRLHLPKEVVNILKDKGITELYRCPDPIYEGFILCPANNWKVFVEAVRKHFKSSNDAEQAFRLLCCGLPANVDRQGRIGITKPCLVHAKVKSGDRVNMLGVGKWFEISVYDNGTEAKELVFKESKMLQNPPSGTKI
jgi:DNA-binding transcriptional regulator/RsmH inhibitor MraZ